MQETIGLREFKNLLEIGGLPELGPGPRDGVLSFDEVNGKLDLLLGESRLQQASRDLVRALILLWHDHLDEAHMIVQGLENADGSFIHGILHRREPDYVNATYWFRRVRDHAAFPVLAERADKLLNADRGLKLQPKPVANGKWDPFAFVQFCEKAAAKPANDPQAITAQKIQGLETEVLLEHFVKL